MSSLINRAGWLVAAVLGLLVVAALAGLVHGGPLDPPGTPAPTNRNLIFQPASCAGFPIIISQPGSYSLGSNITLPGGCTFKDGIDINASNVALDLNGFSVTGLASNSGSGIAAGASTTNLRLSNGIVSTWSGDGIDFTNASNSTIDHVTASGGSGASAIGLGATSVLSECVATGSYNGVAALGSHSTVKGCELAGNISDGVFVGANAEGVLMSGNHVTGSSVAFRISGAHAVVEENVVTNDISSPGFMVNITGGNNIVFRNTADAASNGMTITGGGNDVPGFTTAVNANATPQPWANIGN